MELRWALYGFCTQVPGSQGQPWERAAFCICLPRCSPENVLMEFSFNDNHNSGGLLFAFLELCSWRLDDLIEKWGIEAAVATGNKASPLREHTAPKGSLGWGGSRMAAVFYPDCSLCTQRLGWAVGD
jgi:hypothetical protein